MNREQIKIRKDEMVTMRNGGETLERIARKFRITRERVRQIIGNTGKDFRTKITEKMAESVDLSEMNNEEIANLPGIKKVWEKKAGKIHHINNGLGGKAEDLAHELLGENGIENRQMPFRHPFDILTDGGQKIDVKHSDSNIQFCPSQQMVGPTFRIGHLKSGNDCDFFLVLLPDNRELFQYAVFVIPSSLIAGRSDIRIPWPQVGKKPSKWHQYHDRYDLLKKP